jgi:transcriptional regulator GlxA family with amidase domain
MTGPATERRVVLVGYDGIVLLDLSCAATVFVAVNGLKAPGVPGYQVQMASPGPTARSVEGISLQSELRLADIEGPLDTLLVVGGFGLLPEHQLRGKDLQELVELNRPDPCVVEQVLRVASMSRRVGSICSGAFLLGAAGLLDGKRATTHWSATSMLKRQFPRTEVVPDAIYVQDGQLWTSAGVTAGLDMCLALVEEDHGSAMAARIARWLVVHLRRAGGQRQFSIDLLAQEMADGPVARACAWALQHLDEPMDVEILSQKAHLSTRQFSRRFRAELGTTPSVWLETARFERAKQLLLTTQEPMKRVAAACGYTSVEGFGRAFRKQVGIPPAEFRARFR